MAWKKKYRCCQCGYEAEIYEGKGFMGQHIVAMSCPDCHTIQPIVVGGIIGQVAPSFDHEGGRLCLRCGSARITKWDGKTCPRCGGKMEDTQEKDYWT